MIKKCSNKYLSILMLSIIAILFFASCSMTKNVPEGKYLLDEVEMKLDNKVEDAASLETFIRQQPNPSVPFIGRVGLRIHSIAGTDTAKWANRVIQNIGSAPVIYDNRSTAMSTTQLLREMKNRGYLEAQVDTIQKVKKKRISVTYNIKTGTPYRIREYHNAVEDTTIARIINRVKSRTNLNKGDLFNMSMIETERANISSFLRNVGYYTFSKDAVYFKADTTLNSHEVDLYLSIYPTVDSLPYTRYKINNTTVVSGYNMRNVKAGRYFRDPDTTVYKETTIIRGQQKFLRPAMIQRNSYLRKGRYYSDFLLSRTYENYNNIGAVKQTTITLSPSPEDSSKLLDATIILAPGNVHWFRASLDGTNSAGDFGIAPSLAYQHQNLFNGGEILNIRLKGAYEFITDKKEDDILNQNYYEYGIETSLSFPLFLAPWIKQSWRERSGASTQFIVGFNNQFRPEYTRQFFNGGMSYGWSSNMRKMRHSLDIMDVNYVRMPWMSDRFKDEYMNDSTSNQLLKASYQDQLIARTGYSFYITNKQRNSKLPRVTSIRGGIEVAGTLPRLIAKMQKVKENDLGSKKMLGVAYAEYAKANVDFGQTFPFSSKHTIAYHVGLGIAYPYGNSKILPFETRFFSGGANSVRGWSTRALGPGSYKRKNTSSDFVNQTGDIKLEASIESRHKAGKYFEIAAFVDAGNIWTIKDYEPQPGGKFELSRFYKEIAVAYGLGIRFDLGFLLLRLDTGLRAYDPDRDVGDRLVIHKPSFPRMAWHFGIGYPF